MQSRSIMALSLGLATALSLVSCLGRTDWAGEVESLDASDAPPTTRDELESQRSKAIGGGEVASLSAYMAYLWQFDREHRAWLDLVEVGKSPKLPESLAGFDRKTYTDEALAAWAAVRGPELPRSGARAQLLQADFYATALAGGCRDTQRAMGPLLLLLTEEPDIAGGSSIKRAGAVMESECAFADDVWSGACRAGVDLLRDMPEPEYDDLDGDMWPDPSLRVKFFERCGDVFTDDEKQPVRAYYSMAEPWFAEHYPEEHRAWREEQARIAAAQRAADEQYRREMEEQRAAQQAAAQQSSSSSGAASAPSSSGSSSSSSSSSSLPSNCNFDSDCGSGVKCNSRRCANTSGSSCGFDSDCGGGGAKCNSGKCSNAPDGRCAFDSECAGGRCSSGSCR